MRNWTDSLYWIGMDILLIDGQYNHWKTVSAGGAWTVGHLLGWIGREKWIEGLGFTVMDWETNLFDEQAEIYPAFLITDSRTQIDNIQRLFVMGIQVCLMLSDGQTLSAISIHHLLEMFLHLDFDKHPETLYFLNVNFIQLTLSPP